MNYSRSFLDHNFFEGEIIPLNKKEFHHEINVLRKKVGDKFVVFNGRGHSGLAEITLLNSKKFEVLIKEIFPFTEREGVRIDLGQSLIKNEPFNFALQKATELGVANFTPLITERVVVLRKLNDTQKRIAKWQHTAQGACEQCGENWMPEINEPKDIKDWSIDNISKTKLVLYPDADVKFSEIEITDSVSIAIGPEGDFTNVEIAMLKEAGFIPVTMGSRILRAETAAISAVSAIRYGAKEF